MTAADVAPLRPLLPTTGKVLASVDKAHLMLTLFGGHEWIELKTAANI